MIQLAGITSQPVQHKNGQTLTRYDIHTRVLLSSNRVALLVLGLLVSISVVVAFTSGNTYDSGDSVTHYLYAHWAWPSHYLPCWRLCRPTSDSKGWSCFSAG